MANRETTTHRDVARRVTVEQNGPVLIEGPVEVVLPDGGTATSERVVVAVCTCRRSRIYPWCDTSHRDRKPSETGTSEADPACGSSDGSSDRDPQ